MFHHPYRLLDLLLGLLLILTTSRKTNTCQKEEKKKEKVEEKKIIKKEPEKKGPTGGGVHVQRRQRQMVPRGISPANGGHSNGERTSTSSSSSSPSSTLATTARGPTPYTVSLAHNIGAVFCLLFTSAIEQLVLEMTNLKPSKPAKYGIKSWVACDAQSSYTWKMQIYTGKPAASGAPAAAPKRNQGMRVMLDLTEGLRGPHNVTCDNFYELGRQLLPRNLTMVGTVRKNKPELPPVLLA
ncbi:uncharacterized protein LOC122863534 [Siniperca chuatsi]|uniref:uncharacterized protein LOC122863534 n=1 Tax=Siniperca chuatsi TaxID=119488 RepID=UPI001CE0B8E3|nr:uncharacterized protein LOC122863534 [Siniperca chuatsi]XP_044026048.1 uncharacterized protein LOC122863534 [Siniperca chuatsi]